MKVSPGCGTKTGVGYPSMLPSLHEFLFCSTSTSAIVGTSSDHRPHEQTRIPVLPLVKPTACDAHSVGTACRHGIVGTASRVVLASLWYLSCAPSPPYCQAELQQNILTFCVIFLLPRQNILNLRQKDFRIF